MNRADALIVVICAAIGAFLIVATIVRGSRDLDEGMKRLRLVLHVVLLAFYRALWAAALALLVVGWYRKNYDYWYIAFGVLLIGLMLFRDLSAPSGNPFREWFSRNPMGERVRGMEEETSRLAGELVRERHAGAGGGDSGQESSEGESDFAQAFRRAAAEAARPEEGTDVQGRPTRTWTFRFQWPPGGRGV